MPRIEAPTVAQHHAMRRGQVVQAAVEILAAVGSGGLTPAAVAARAGLARSSLYQYFPSTEALLAAAVSELLVRAGARIRATVGTDGPAGLRVAAYVRAAIVDAHAGHGSVADLISAPLPPPCREAVREHHDQLVEPLRRALVDGDVADPDMTTMLAMGAVNAALMAVTHGAPLDVTVRSTVDFVLRGAGLPAAAAGGQPNSS